MTRLGTDAKGRDTGRKQYIDRVRKAAAAYGGQPVEDPGTDLHRGRKSGQRELLEKGTSSQRKRKKRNSRSKK